MGNGSAPNDPEFLTAAEIAKRFRVSRSTVYRWGLNNELPSVQVGGVVRFRASDVERLLLGSK